MDSTSAKTAVYVFLVLVVGALLGIALLRFSRASQAGQVKPLTTQQKLDALRKSPGIVTPQGRNFVRNQADRQQETKDAMDQVVGGQ